MTPGSTVTFADSDEPSPATTTLAACTPGSENVSEAAGSKPEPATLSGNVPGACALGVTPTTSGAGAMVKFAVFDENPALLVTVTVGVAPWAFCATAMCCVMLVTELTTALPTSVMSGLSDEATLPGYKPVPVMVSATFEAPPPATFGETSLIVGSVPNTVKMGLPAVPGCVE